MLREERQIQGAAAKNGANVIQRRLIGDLFTLTRSVIETGAKYKPLLTLCDALLPNVRWFAFADPVDILAIGIDR